MQQRPAIRRVLSITIAATTIGAVLLAVVAAAALPAVRHVASGWWNDPERLAGLPENPQIHHEDGAIDHARTVAGLLPAATARVEAIHGRPFAHRVTVGVYASPESFAAANGTGSPGAVGALFLGHVILSPVLFSTQRHRLRTILTHELSHAHVRSWMSELAYIRLPNWFKEGLAVMVSGGGGAEGVSESLAREAIRHGDHIAIATTGSVFDPVAIRFEQPPEIPSTSFRTQMAYRQAGLFVAFLHDTNPDGFARLMDAVLDGRSLTEAVAAGYDTDLYTLWLRFARTKDN